MRPHHVCAAVLGMAAALTPIAGYGATYRVDPSHSAVTFKIRHLFTSVAGRFTVFEGRIVFDPEKPLETTVEGNIDTASVNTDNQKRDKHLRSEEFFDVATHPKITFATSRVSDVNAQAKTAKLHGTLSIHGVERSVVLDAAFLGVGKDPWGNERAGFRGQTTIDRKDFGLTWNKPLETGGLLVGDEVEIEIEIEAVREQ